MKDGFIADASLGVSWTVPSQATVTTDDLLNNVLSGSHFVVPAFWMFEVANTMLIFTRRKLLSQDESSQGRRRIRDMSPIIDDEGPRLALGTIYDLASEHGLSIYDAIYLELALRRQLPLASRDSVLNKAAKRCGLKLLL